MPGGAGDSHSPPARVTRTRGPLMAEFQVGHRVRIKDWSTTEAHAGMTGAVAWVSGRLEPGRARLLPSRRARNKPARQQPRPPTNRNPRRPVSRNPMSDTVIAYNV